jgi:OPA family sugar phosphate sensor protein UhpC-like MFS transporter
MLLSIILFWFIPPGYLYADSLVMFIIGFCIFGPQMMIGLVAAELSHKKAAASSTGFVGFFAYIGAACAGYPLGTITQNLGWQGFYWSLVICCVISVILLLPLWSVTAASLRRKLPPKVKESLPSQKVVS